MALTGRTALIAALGALIAGLLPGWGGIAAVCLPLLAAIGVGQIAASLAAPAAVAVGARRSRALLALGLLGWAAQGVAYARTAKFMRVRPGYAPLAPIAGTAFGVLLLDGAVRAARGSLSWKGRRS